MADTDSIAGHERRPDNAQEGPGGRHSDRGGLGPDLADADRTRQLQPRRREPPERGWFGDSSETLANPNGPGREEQRGEGRST